MLNNLSLLNKIYPQSFIRDNSECDVLKKVYVVKLSSPDLTTPNTFIFETLEKALDEIRDTFRHFDWVSFEVSRYTCFDDDDSIKFDDYIFYEF